MSRPHYQPAELLPDAEKTVGRLRLLPEAGELRLELLLLLRLELLWLEQLLLWLVLLLRLELLGLELLLLWLVLLLLLLVLLLKLLPLADVLLDHLLGGLLSLLQYAGLYELLDHLLGHLLDDRVLGQRLDDRVRLRLLLHVAQLLDLLCHPRLLAEQLDDLLPDDVLGNSVGEVLLHHLLLFLAEPARGPPGRL